MWRGLGTGLAVLAAAQVVLSSYFGVSLQAGLLFWLFVGLTVLPAWRVARALFPWAGLADAIIRAGVIAFSEIVLAGLTLGSAGFLSPTAYLAMFAIACAVVFVVVRPGAAPTHPLPAVPLHLAAIVIPLLAFIVGVGLVQSPFTLYDSVSYHLVFPARWLLDHRLSIVQTPFSDPAQAYQPANGELLFLWLMLPFHGDVAARIGQLPFLALSAAALYAIARRCGARPQHAVYAPLFFMLARPVVEQAVGADVDLICAALFLASLALGLVAAERDTTRDWALWGVGVGLYLGTKYLALVYVVVLLVLPVLRGVRWRALAALPGLLVLGAPWYARNWIVAGSPIYPASLSVLGLTIARGAFTRAAMNNSVFHVTSVRLLPAILAHAFGAAAFLFWLPMAVLAAGALVARRHWWPAGYVCVAPIIMLGLFWFGIPDNADSRFLLPAVALAMVPLTFAFGSGSRRDALLQALYLSGAAWLIVGSSRQIPMALPWFMGDWLALDGLVSRQWLPFFAAGAIVTIGVAYPVSRRPERSLPLLTMVFIVGCAVLGVAAGRAAARSDESPLRLSPTHIRAGFIDGWDWVHRSLAGARLANTGNNLPYPLFGERLANQVYYVNIDRHADWRFHDYARVRARSGAAASHDLAEPSGQLMPLAGPAADASRPRYERREGNPEAWVRNLRDAKITHLFVSVLSAYELGYVRHNEGGFPVEDDWAKANPRIFSLLYDNGQTRIYAVATP